MGLKNVPGTETVSGFFFNVNTTNGRNEVGIFNAAQGPQVAEEAFGNIQQG